MNTVSRRARWVVGLFPVLLVVWGSWFGCGAGDYKSRISNRVDRLGAESSFNNLNPARPLGNSRVSVRIPKIFGEPDRLVECTKAERIALPDLLMQEKAVVYEAMLPQGDDPAEGKVACYLHFWIVERKGANLGLGFGQWMQKKVPEDIRVDFKQVPLKSELGNEHVWQFATADWVQPFYCEVDKTGGMQEKDGRVAIYGYEHDSGSLQVVMAVRAPKAVWEKQNLKALADQTAGCITIKPIEAASP